MPVDPGTCSWSGPSGAGRWSARRAARARPRKTDSIGVLMRLLAGLEVPREAITGMGVGGLLMEIVTRPQPRDEPVAAGAQSIAALVLAAGRSTRMGGPNKLVAEIGGKPLVRIAAEAGLGITRQAGHRGDRPSARRGRGRARRSAGGGWCTIPTFADGLATSVKAGIAAVPAAADGRRHLPRRHAAVDAELINRLIAAFAPEDGALAVIPTFNGKRGNPVVVVRARFFPISWPSRAI